jgi:hypothetical protein
MALFLQNNHPMPKEKCRTRNKALRWLGFLLAVCVPLLANQAEANDGPKIVNIAAARDARNALVMVQRGGREKPRFIWTLLDRMSSADGSEFMTAVGDYEALLRIDTPETFRRILFEQKRSSGPLSFVGRIVAAASQNAIAFADFREMLRDHDLALKLIRDFETLSLDFEPIEREHLIDVLILSQPRDPQIRTLVARKMADRYMGRNSEQELPKMIAAVVSNVISRGTMQNSLLESHRQYLLRGTPPDKNEFLKALYSPVFHLLRTSPVTLSDYETLSQTLNVWFSAGGPWDADMMKQWMRLLALPAPISKDSDIAIYLADRQMKRTIVRLLLQAPALDMNFNYVLRTPEKIWEGVSVQSVQQNSAHQKAEILGLYMQKNADLQRFCLNKIRLNSTSLAQRATCWRALDTLTANAPWDSISEIVQDRRDALVEFMAFAPNAFALLQDPTLNSRFQIGATFASIHSLGTPYELNRIRTRALVRRPQSRHTGPTDIHDHAFLNEAIVDYRTPIHAEDYATVIHLFRTALVLRNWDPRLQMAALNILNQRSPREAVPFHESAVHKAIEYLTESLDRMPLPESTWTHFLGAGQPNLQPRLDFVYSSSVARSLPSLQDELFDLVEIHVLTSSVFLNLEMCAIGNHHLQRAISSWLAVHADAQPYLESVAPMVVQGIFETKAQIIPGGNCTVHLLPEAQTNPEAPTDKQ